MQIISIIASAIVFGMWAFSMFSTFFGLRKRAETRTGQTWPGPRAMLTEIGLWLKDPETGPDRRRLALMTAAVFVLSLLTGMSLAA